jgi:hypothetical protein
MSEIVIEKITEGLKAAGSDWALSEDSAKAVIRVASDTSINGKPPKIAQPDNMVDP